MSNLFFVALGGAIGASLRHLCRVIFLRTGSAGFPWSTLLINVLGSLAMGLLIGWLAKRAGGTSDEMHLFLVTGLLGGFTTFSAFSLDFVQLWQRGESALAISYVAASVALSLIAIFIGLWLMKTT